MECFIFIFESKQKRCGLCWDLQPSLHQVDNTYVKQMFDELDKDKDGKIDRTEIQSLLNLMNQQAGDTVLNGVFKFLDKDGNQAIDFDEFVKFYQSNFEIPTDVMMKSFFQSYDKNGDGFLSKAEMKDVMIKMGAPVSGDILDVMLTDVDKNKDGKISYEEFIKMMKD